MIYYLWRVDWCDTHFWAGFSSFIRRSMAEHLDPLNTSAIETSHAEGLNLENPSAAKVRLRQLLRQVEKEFEAVLIENVALRKELEPYGGSSSNQNNTHGTSTSKLRASNIFPMIEIPPRSEKRKFKKIEKFISTIEFLSLLFWIMAEFKEIKEIEKFISSIEFLSLVFWIIAEIKEIEKFISSIKILIIAILNHRGNQGNQGNYLHHCYSESWGNSRKSRNLSPPLLFWIMAEFKEFKEIKEFISSIEFLSLLFSITAEFKEIKEFISTTVILNHGGIQGIQGNQGIYVHHCYSESWRNSRKSRKSRNLSPALNSYHWYSESSRKSRKSRNLSPALNSYHCYSQSSRKSRKSRKLSPPLLFWIMAEFKEIKEFISTTVILNHGGIQGNQGNREIYLQHWILIIAILNHRGNQGNQGNYLHHCYSESWRNSRKSRNLSPPLLFWIMAEFKEFKEIKEFISSIEFLSLLFSITAEFKEIKEFISTTVILNHGGIQGIQGNQGIYLQHWILIIVILNHSGIQGNQGIYLHHCYSQSSRKSRKSRKLSPPLLFWIMAEFKEIKEFISTTVILNHGGIQGIQGNQGIYLQHWILIIVILNHSGIQGNQGIYLHHCYSESWRNSRNSRKSRNLCPPLLFWIMAEFKEIKEIEKFISSIEFLSLVFWIIAEIKEIEKFISSIEFLSLLFSIIAEIKEIKEFISTTVILNHGGIQGNQGNQGIYLHHCYSESWRNSRKSRKSRNLSPPLLFWIIAEFKEFKEIKEFISSIEFLSLLFSITAEFKEIKEFISTTVILNHGGIQGIQGNQGIYVHHCCSESWRNSRKSRKSRNLSPALNSYHWYSESSRKSRKSRNLSPALNSYHCYSQSSRKSRKSRNLSPPLLFWIMAEFKEIKEIKEFISTTVILNHGGIQGNQGNQGIYLHHCYSESWRNSRKSRKSRNLSPPLLFWIMAEFVEIKEFISTMELLCLFFSSSAEFKEISELKEVKRNIALMSALVKLMRKSEEWKHHLSSIDLILPFLQGTQRRRTLTPHPTPPTILSNTHRIQRDVAPSPTPTPSTFSNADRVHSDVAPSACRMPTLTVVT